MSYDREKKQKKRSDEIQREDKKKSELYCLQIKLQICSRCGPLSQELQLDGLDGTRACAELLVNEVVVPHEHVLGGAEAGDEAVDVVLRLALVQLAAESVGAMRQLFNMTVQYAKERVAFGRPIGSFQAVKHLLADLSLLVELSSAIADEAANALQAGRPDSAELASVAKAYVGEAGIQVSQGCLQVHGGIGYTWEHDLHLYLRRLASDAALFGDPSWHRERLCLLDGLAQVPAP